MYSICKYVIFDKIRCVHFKVLSQLWPWYHPMTDKLAHHTSKCPANERRLDILYVTYCHCLRLCLWVITQDILRTAKPGATRWLGWCLHRDLGRSSTDCFRCGRQSINWEMLCLTLAIMATIQGTHSLHDPMDTVSIQVKLLQCMTSWHVHPFGIKTQNTSATWIPWSNHSSQFFEQSVIIYSLIPVRKCFIKMFIRNIQVYRCGCPQISTCTVWYVLRWLKSTGWFVMALGANKSYQ